jgi:hypothetical protein
MYLDASRSCRAGTSLSEFPWFKAATIQQILSVLRLISGHLYGLICIYFACQVDALPGKFPAVEPRHFSMLS